MRPSPVAGRARTHRHDTPEPCRRPCRMINIVVFLVRLVDCEPDFCNRPGSCERPMSSDRAERDASERWHFHSITNTPAHEEVVEQITFAVLSGAYRPGERLPNIEALARLMGVSKPVVGEALKVLAGASVVRALRGVNGGV